MDVVVTVPKRKWLEWINEGDLPGEKWTGEDSYFWCGNRIPRIAIGERVYIVAYGRLRGYAPLVRIHYQPDGVALVRRDRAQAVTIPLFIDGFQGWRYRWWNREEEETFDNWQMEGIA